MTTRIQCFSAEIHGVLGHDTPGAAFETFGLLRVELNGERDVSAELAGNVFHDVAELANAAHRVERKSGIKLGWVGRPGRCRFQSTDVSPQVCHARLNSATASSEDRARV